jgi:phosphonate transport system ATP-binding protein
VNLDAVVFAGVGKTFADGTRALNDVSFAVAAGEFCVILGPSGSGKSTLLRTVNGLAVPDAGCIVLGGEALTPITLPRLRRRVAMIYQQFALVNRASVAHNVIAGALPEMPTLRAVLGLFGAKDKQKACDLLAAVGLAPEHLMRRVSELSGGQQQRVGIARAFMADPTVILADEPVASLDPRTSRDIMTLLRREARERGATVLCSLHQLDLAMEFADRIVALRNGEAIFNGPPSAFTASVETRIYAVDKALAS